MSLCRACLAIVLCCGLPATGFALQSSGFHPNMSLDLSHHDNIRAVPDGLKESDYIFAIQPELAWVWRVGKHQLDAIYKGAYGFYTDHDDLDFENHQLTARAQLDHSLRFKSLVETGYQFSHDKPGETDARSGLLDTNDEWTQTRSQFALTYGRNDAKGQLKTALRFQQRRYDAIAEQFRNFNLWKSTSTFYYRFLPKTQALIEFGIGSADYKQTNVFSDQSNQETSLQTGISWAATRKTSGEFKIGYRNRDYDNQRFNNLSGLAISLDGDWRPNTFSKITFGITRDNQDSAQANTGGFVRNEVRLGVAHGFTTRTALIAGVRYSKDEFETTLGREDTRWAINVGVKHSMLRWLDVGVGIQALQRDSSDAQFDFQSNIIMFTISTVFD